MRRDCGFTMIRVIFLTRYKQRRVAPFAVREMGYPAILLSKEPI
jgi:hypothetical protein